MTLTVDELRSSARQVFGAQAINPAQIWSQIVAMGWLSLCVPERLGGLGLETAVQSLIHHELGRVLGPGRFAVQMAAIDLFVRLDRGDLIGSAVAGLLTTTSQTFDTATVRMESVFGQLNAVPDADQASNILVAASDRLILLPLDQPGIAISPTPIWDESRLFFEVTLDDVAIEPEMTLAAGEDAAREWDQLNTSILRAVASDSLGGADFVLGMTLEHLQTRQQFGRPLAMFQALKHRCADMKTALAAAEALIAANWDYGGDAPGSSYQTTKSGALKALATETYHDIVEEAVQLHGGIGLTEEHQCHLYLKRALLNETLGGSADIWNETFGRLALEIYAP